MKIGPKQEVAPLDAALRVDGRTTGQSAASGSTTGGADVDSVKLSSASVNLGASQLSVRADKVTAIRQAIDEGKYQMDIEAIADNMIADAARLIQTLGLPPGRIN